MGKLHVICELSGVIHSFNHTKANVHGIQYLKDAKIEYSKMNICYKTWLCNKIKFVPSNQLPQQFTPL